MAKAKLVKDFKTLSQGQKLADVDAAFEKARQETFPEIVTGPLSKLFDSQMETLKQRGCPSDIIKALVKMKNGVISKALKNQTPKNHIPFIPVIPRSMLNIDEQMKMVHYRDKKGYNYLNQSALKDVVDIPGKLYFIFDVEDGQDMLGKSPEKAESLIKKSGRSCLTTEEVIALCIHTNVLSEHYVDCTGSRYGRAGLIPFVYLGGDGPELRWHYSDDANDEWGSASCRSWA